MASTAENVDEQKDVVAQKSRSKEKRESVGVLDLDDDILKEKGNEYNIPTISDDEYVVCNASEVSFLCPYFGKITGTLYITNYKLLFLGDGVNEDYVVECTLGNISRVDKMGSTSNQKKDVYGLEIHCKDIRNLKFALKQDTNPRRKVYDMIQNYAFPISNGRSYFAYDFKVEYKVNGWDVYDSARELERQGLPTDCWRFTDANCDYRLCDTYPSVIAVPSTISDEEVKSCATFRSRSRLPVLSWLHPANNASITRCAQPNIGVGGVRRNKDDEKYIQAILEANPQCHKLFIMDARPKINAVANQAKGGGYEDIDNYPNTELVFLDIANIHVMRDSLRKLKDMIFPEVDDAHFLSNLEATKWLDHIKGVLAGASRMADTVERCRTSCIVHCSDGWDRTPQLTALAMLLLDPYYRTLQGFQVLIEKEWCSFGHKFGQRYGLGDKNYSDDQRSPIFCQFIDAVWQVTKQFPCAFEFNEHFLINILDHLNSNLFGTFLYNSESVRMKEDVQNRTNSLWSHINSAPNDYMNPLYARNLHQHVILPVASVRHLKLWKGYYMRWNPRTQPQYSIEDVSRLLFMRVNQLRKMCDNLQGQVDARTLVKVEGDKNNKQTNKQQSSSRNKSSSEATSEQLSGSHDSVADSTASFEQSTPADTAMAAEKAAEEKVKGDQTQKRYDVI